MLPRLTLAVCLCVASVATALEHFEAFEACQELCARDKRVMETASNGVMTWDWKKGRCLSHDLNGTGWGCLTARCPVPEVDRRPGELSKCREAANWIELDVHCEDELRYHTVADGPIAARGSFCTADGRGPSADAAVEEFDNKHVVQSKVVEGQGFGDRSHVSTDAKGCEGQGRPGCPKSLVVGDAKGEAAKILEEGSLAGE